MPKNGDLKDGKEGNTTLTFQWLNGFLKQHPTVKVASIGHLEKVRTDGVTL